ncbi:MAG: FHA domain-containing protein [Planctomycetota bacterium]
MSAEDRQDSSALGFIALQEQTTGRSKADFVQLYPHPFLLMDPGSGAHSSGAFKTQVTPGSSSGTGKGNTTRRAPPRSTAPSGDAMGRVFLVNKRGVNSFATMVTVGRAKNNDVDLDNTSISKFHAYFVQQTGSWFVVDVKSANGTFVNGEQITPQTQKRLANGDSLRFGNEIAARFFDAGGFYDLLRGEIA